MKVVMKMEMNLAVIMVKIFKADFFIIFKTTRSKLSLSMLHSKPVMRS